MTLLGYVQVIASGILLLYIYLSFCLSNDNRMNEERTWILKDKTHFEWKLIL